MKAACLALLLLATPALAQSPADACYLRRYSADHLARHPEQLVTAIAIAPSAQGGPGIALDLFVRLRGGFRAMGSAYCSQDGEGLDCLMEGDAGRFGLVPAAGGQKLSVARRGIGFEGEDGFVTLSGTAGDDRVFLLPPLGARACRALIAAGSLD